MTARLVPIVEDLRDAPGHAERAEWLCTAPEAIILRDHLKIRDLLRRDGFVAGERYLSTMIARIHARRLKDGRHPATILMAEEMARGQMMDAVRGKGDSP